jgi:tetratricopeptide (TPR) repeat protein
MTFRRLVCALIVAVAVSPASRAASTDDGKSKVVFDKGSDDDFVNGKVYNEKTASQKRDERRKNREKEEKKLAKSVEFHIKQLKSSKDEDERATAAEYLGVLNAYIAIPDLIDCLRPDRQEKDVVMRAASGSLIKLTQKNFGVKGYDDWQKWWIKNKLDFMAKVKDEVSETDKITAQSENMVGLELNKRGVFREAYPHFVTAIDKNPKMIDYHNNAGVTLLNMGLYLDAMEHFKDAMGLNPAVPDPYMNIGRCYSKMGRSIEAHAWYKQASEKDPTGILWANYWMVGKEYLKSSDYKLAYEYLDQARTKAEKQRVRDPRLYNDIAICHYGLDQYHSAWKELCNVRILGYEPNPDFVKKVRKVLIDNGTDPDEEDRLAVEHFRSIMKGDEEAPAVKKAESIIDSVK